MDPQVAGYLELLRGVYGPDHVQLGTPATDEQLKLSARNLPTVDVILADSLNVVDLIKADTIVIEQPALARIEEVYS